MTGMISSPVNLDSSAAPSKTPNSRAFLGDGTLQIPDGVSKAALWGAALDGSAGATLIAGHINWAGRLSPLA